MKKSMAMTPTYTMPEFSVYPEFVPDQVLTSEHLNRLFDYLDEQERMTRASLLGIGIVCGLDVKADSSGITITRGVGVTSEGYLVRQEKDIRYTAYRTYDPVQKTYYEKFVNTAVNPATQRFSLTELRKEKETGDDKDLTAIPGSMNNYVVLLFVELLQDPARNCDPTSCDDKGISVEATIRPLLMAGNPPDLAIVYQQASNPQNQSPFLSLPEVRIPRYAVPRTSGLVESTDVLNAYLTILSGADAQLLEVKNALGAMYAQLPAAIKEAIGDNPFAGLPAKFLPDVNTREKLLHLQYYYDLVSDLLQAYDEFRKVGNDLLSACCPDAGLFPRHLLLGNVKPDTGMTKANRHNFLYSPLFQKRNYLQELRFLAARIRAMIDGNNILLAGFRNNLPAADVRATPSLLWDRPLSQKAIPYYFNYDQLKEVWNFSKAVRQKTTQNLSYEAKGRSGVDSWVSRPLQFDLEPYNFLRIEGHIGKPYTDVMKQLTALKETYRLPVDIIALSTGSPDLSKIPESLIHCNIRDLEVSYEIVRREWEAVVGRMIEYLDDIKKDLLALLRLANIKPAVFYAYHAKLREAKKFMDEVLDLKTLVLRFQHFITNLYEPVEKGSSDLRSPLVQLLNHQKIEPAPRNLAEDLIDHLDEVILSCKKGGFRSVEQQFQLRIEELYRYLYLSTFVQKHPGIQHKAGVPLGGTFILVYHKTKKGTGGPATLRGRVLRASGAPVNFGSVAALQTSVTVAVSDGGVFQITVPSLPVVLRAVSLNTANGQAQTGDLLVTSPSQTLTIVVPSPPIVPQGGATVFDTLEENKVIADFYLPYLCASNCTPIQFVIQEQVNHAPVAEAGPDQQLTQPQNATVLDGSASTDPEKGPLTYHWALVSGQQNVAIANTDEEKTGVSNLAEPGDYIFELTVTDDMGRSHADRVTVTVKPAPNQPPAANAGEDQRIQLPQSSVRLEGSGTDPEGGELTFLWTKERGPEGGSIADPSSAVTEVSGLQPGTYHFMLTVFDDKNATGVDSVQVIVLEKENEPPTASANASATVINVGESVRLTGSGTDPENGPLEYTWTKTGGQSVVIFADPSSAETLVSGFTVAGPHSFLLTVRDQGGKEAYAPVSVNVEAVNQPPVAKIKTPIVVTLPDAFVRLDGTSSYDPEGEALSFTWSTQDPFLRFTNKTSATPIAYGFPEARPSEAWLVVRDQANLTGEDKVLITVTGERRSKECQSLVSIEEAFSPYGARELPHVRRLLRAFPGLIEIQDYFTLLLKEKIAEWPLTRQTDFFRDATFAYNGEGTNPEGRNIPIIEAIRLWMERLLPLVQELDTKELSNHALTLVRILASLAAYMGCIQRDPQQKQVPVTDLFGWLLEKQLRLLQEVVRKMDDALLLQLVQLRLLFDDEIFLIDNAGQAAEKADYRAVLEMLRKALDKLLDF